VIPPKVIAELHAALKEAESVHDQSATAFVDGRGEDAEHRMRAAALRYQQITARALVTLLASVASLGYTPEGS
jgi:hypothetical protein